MIQDKIFFDEKDPTGLSYNTPFTVYGSYQGRLWSKTPTGSIKFYTQNSDLSVYATTGSNQFSGSQTVTGSLTVTGGITGTATTASYVEYTGVANKPTLVSGSAQVTYSGLTGVPAGIVSSSAQVGGYGIFATTGSNSFNGSQAVTGSLTVTGQVVAQTLNVQQVTSSIVYSSGSNIFGNTLGNTQQFTGSVSVTGSLTVNGVATSGTVSGTTNYVGKFTGTNTIGNSLFTDNGTNGGYNNTGVAARTFIIQATSGRPLALELIESANVHAIYMAPNNSGFNRISSDYMSGGVFLPLSLTGRENNADLVLQTNGNIGMGTTSPSASLHVVRANDGGSGTPGVILSTANGANDIVRFQDGTTTVAVVKNSGDLGVGVSSLVSPGGSRRLLQISNSTNGALIALGNSITESNNPRIFSGQYDLGFAAGVTTGIINFYTNDTERMRITSAGNTEIRSGNILNIYRTDNTRALQLSTTNNECLIDAWAASSEPLMLRSNGSGGRIVFHTNGAEQVRINPDGDLIIKGTLADFTLGGSGAEVFFGRNATNYITANGGTSATVRIISNTNGVELSNGATSWVAVSDENLKEMSEWKPFENSVEKILSLRAGTSRYKTDEKETSRSFLIAQDVQEVLPEAVSEYEDGTLGLRYTEVIPLLVAAVQELKSENDILKSILQRNNIS
jgi:hypothetical protein